MASSGNTWQKKLMNKSRLHTLKVKGVKARFSLATLSEMEIEPQHDNRVFRRHGRRFGSRRAA